MYTPDQLKMMMDLFNNPLLKKGADEFYAHLQREGLESARKFWMNSSYANMFPDQQFMERLFDFYKNMGFVPLNQYEALQKENTKLKDTRLTPRNGKLVTVVPEGDTWED